LPFGCIPDFIYGPSLGLAKPVEIITNTIITHWVTLHREKIAKAKKRKPGEKSPTKGKEKAAA